VKPKKAMPVGRIRKNRGFSSKNAYRLVSKMCGMHTNQAMKLTANTT